MDESKSSTALFKGALGNLYDRIKPYFLLKKGAYDIKAYEKLLYECHFKSQPNGRQPVID